MYRVLIDTYNKLTQGEIPIVYVLIGTHLGYRAYAEKKLGKVFDVLATILDGSWILDGSVHLGSDSIGTIDTSARLLNVGNFERTLTSKKDDVLIAFERKQLQHIFVELDHADRYFSKLISKEPFLSRNINLFIGFEEEPHTNHISIFEGVISEMSVLSILTIEADER